MTPSKLGRTRCWLSVIAIVSCARSPDISVPRAGIASCKRRVPVECSGPVPVYADNVEPVLRAKCFGCYTGSGEAAEDHDFSSALGVFAQRWNIQHQVSACAMPPSRAPGLSEAQANDILTWVSCSHAEDAASGGTPTIDVNAAESAERSRR